MRAKGYSYLLLSVFFNACAVHLAKSVLDNCSPATTMALNCYWAALGFLLAGCVARRFHAARSPVFHVSPAALLDCMRRNRGLVFLPPVFGALGGWSFYMTVDWYGANTAAFLGNQTFVMLVLGGLALGEVIRWPEGIAVFFTLAGAFVFSYQCGEIRWAALALMAGASLFTALKQLLVKRISERDNLTVVMTTVLVFMALSATVLAVATSSWTFPGARELAYMAVAALAGSILGMSLLYAAYHLLGVSRGAPLNTLRPLMVLIIGLILGREVPVLTQYTGGLMIVMGSAALCLLHHRLHPQPDVMATIDMSPAETS